MKTLTGALLALVLLFGVSCQTTELGEGAGFAAAHIASAELDGDYLASRTEALQRSVYPPTRDIEVEFGSLCHEKYVACYLPHEDMIVYDLAALEEVTADWTVGRRRAAYEDMVAHEVAHALRIRKHGWPDCAGKKGDAWETCVHVLDSAFKCFREALQGWSEEGRIDVRHCDDRRTSTGR